MGADIGTLVNEILTSDIFTKISPARNTEFVCINSIDAAGCIADARTKGLIPEPPAAVLDLGSGNGVVVALFAAHGYDTYGIEIQDTLVAHAQRNLVDCNLPATIAQGNYFPPDVRQRTHPREHVLLTETPDPYLKLGKQIDEFDLFFIFPFIKQRESIFDLFNTHAQQGARLLVARESGHWPYPDGITRIAVVYDRYSVYEKA